MSDAKLVSTTKEMEVVNDDERTSDFPWIPVGFYLETKNLEIAAHGPTSKLVTEITPFLPRVNGK